HQTRGCLAVGGVGDRLGNCGESNQGIGGLWFGKGKKGMGLKHKVNVYIPTLNAGKIWEEVVKTLTEQTYPISQVVIIDSGSSDGTLDKIKEDFKLIAIDKKDFDHGGTRKMAIERYPEADIYVFLTQDAIPANEFAIENMVNAFDDHPKLGMVYGRQLP